MMSFMAIITFSYLGMQFVHLEPVAVFNKGNITLHLEYNDTIKFYHIDWLTMVYNTSEASFDITDAIGLAYKESSFIVKGNGYNPSLIVKYRPPKVIFARIGENVSMKLELNSIPEVGYTVQNLDRGITLFDVFKRKDYLAKLNNRFSDDQEKVAKFGIQNIKRSDAGQIVATGSQGLKSTQGILLVVIDKPTKPVIFTNEPKFAGDDAIFFCNSKSTSLPDYYNISLSYIWYIDNVEQLTTTNKLVVKSISKPYKGKTITCKAVENGTVSDLSDPICVTETDNGGHVKQPVIIFIHLTIVIISILLPVMLC